MKPGKEIVKDKQKNSSLKHRQKNIVNNHQILKQQEP